MSEKQNDEALKKLGRLLDAVSSPGSSIGLSLDKHSEEAVELKREWFKSVFSGIEKTNNSIEKAQQAIGDLQSNLHTHEQDSYRKLMEVKDAFNLEIKDLRIKYATDLEKIHERLERNITRVTEKFDVLPGNLSKVKEDLRIDVSNLKTELLDNIDRVKNNILTIEKDIKEKEIKPLTDKVTNLTIRVAVISCIAGLVGSAVFSIVLAYIKS
jgi:SMC interacting uncharacterized protein involved in chromosome segregation